MARVPTRRVPAYFDAMLDAWAAGWVGREVHFGWWPEPPPPGPLDFAAAQARLTEQVLGLAAPAAGMRVLDVGCGFGGVLEALAAGCPGLHRAGLNIDPRQLAICAGLSPRPWLVAGDAGALPFVAGGFDLLICLEAAFHFASRARFLAEAARVLRPGGALVLADILLAPPRADAPFGAAAAAAALDGEYGPWPEPWLDREGLLRAAAAAGLVAEAERDLTEGTSPTHRITAPVGQVPASAAGGVLRELHAAGCLRYAAFRFRRARELHPSAEP